MKTIAITLPEELDKKAADEARRRGISKSELIREGLAGVLPPSGSEMKTDLWRSLAGFGGDSISAETGDIDDVLYGS